MFNKKIAISGFASTQLIGGSVAAIVLSQTSTEKPNKKINLKDILIKQGYKEPASFGPKIILLRQYGDLKNIEGGLSQWCKNNSEIAKEDYGEELIKKFKEICFETIASKIEYSDFEILKTGEEENRENWSKALSDFQKDYAESAGKKPSDKWSNTSDLQNFQNQCKKHEREPFFDEQNELFQEVKKYCARKKD